MSNQTPDKSRRTLLKGVLAAPAITLAGFHGSAQAALLAESDPVAQALGYVTTSATDGQACANCALYQGGGAAQGGCPIFPGKEVLAAGWCKSWVVKP